MFFDSSTLVELETEFSAVYCSEESKNQSRRFLNNQIAVEISKKYDDMATVRKMKEIVPEYKSNNSKYEQLDHEQKVPVKDVVLEMK